MTLLIVGTEEQDRADITSLLEEIEDANVIESSNIAEALNLCASVTIDIVLLNISQMLDESISAIKAFRKTNNRPMVIAVSNLPDSYSKSLIMKAGTTDYFTKPINRELFFTRLKNYESLLRISHERSGTNEWAINPFASKVYSRKVLFRVTKESSLAEFWEYYVFHQDILTNELCSCIKAIYNSGLILLNSHKLFDIIVEEDDETLYFTVVKIEGYNKKKIKDIFEKEFPEGIKRLGESAFSILLKKSIYELESIDVHHVTALPPAVLIESEPKVTTAKKVEDTAEESMRILRHSFVDKVDAMSFLAEQEDTFLDKIDSLECVEDDLDCDIFELETSGKIEYLYKISHGIIDYARAVEDLNEFGNITFALFKLAEDMINLKSSDMDEKKLAKLTILLKSLHSDLSQWRRNIFIIKTTQDIHYLDSSLISSCMQIESIFKPEQIENDDDELELF